MVRTDFKRSASKSGSSGATMAHKLQTVSSKGNLLAQEFQRDLAHLLRLCLVLHPLLVENLV